MSIPGFKGGLLNGTVPLFGLIHQLFMPRAFTGEMRQPAVAPAHMGGFLRENPFNRLPNCHIFFSLGCLLQGVDMGGKILATPLFGDINCR
jgi:hypothetical protein